MAIPLIYKSCLSENALDLSIQDWLQVAEKQKAQDIERAEYEEQQAEIREEKQKAGEPVPEDDKEWPKIEAAPFETSEQKFVICIDTLGQDRELSEEERRFAVENVLNFKEKWE